MTTRYLYLSLVGTSVLRNAATAIKDKWASSYSDVEAWHNMPLEDSRNRYPSGFLCRLDALEPELYADMLDAARELGERASAEVSGLVGIASVRGHRKDLAEVLLYPTASCTSLLSAKLNRGLLAEMDFARVEIRVLEKLGKWETFEEGLVELLDKVVDDIVNARKEGLRVFVNATPGFKVESSFLVLASILAGADGVVYIHETFREPVFIPAVPVRVSESFVEHVRNVADSEGRIPVEAWGYLDMELRQMLEERGIVRREKDYFEIRPWIRLLVGKLYRVW